MLFLFLYLRRTLFLFLEKEKGFYDEYWTPANPSYIFNIL